MIEALLSVRIPELWVTAVTEQYDVELTCQVGGPSGSLGWGLATIRGEDAILNKVLDEVRNHRSVGSVSIQAREKGSVSFIVEVVRCKACEVLVRSKAFMVFPVLVEKGRMKWLIITDNNRTIGELSSRLEEYGCDVRIERVSILREKGILTERQEEVIGKALTAGYFDYPRKADSEALARELGISVSTLSEVVRAAQRRIFSEYFRS